MDEYCGYDVEDVHSGTELDEVMCEVCGTIQLATNTVCSHCGEQLENGISKRRKKKVKKRLSYKQEVRRKSGRGGRIFFLGFVILIAAIFVAIYILDKSYKGKDNAAEAENTRIKAEISEDGYVTYPCGEYVVGVDIPAGEYFLYYMGPDSANDYNEGYAGLHSKIFDRTIYYSWFENSFYATVKDGQKFDTMNCTLYKLSKPFEKNDPYEQPGMYKVGFDIEPGTYTIISDSDKYAPYYAIHKNSKDYDDETFMNGGSTFPNEDYEETIIVQNGEYLELRFCKLKK